MVVSRNLSTQIPHLVKTLNVALVSQLKGLQTNHFITHLIDVLLEEDVGGNGGSGGNGNKKSLLVGGGGGNNCKSSLGFGGCGADSICSVDDWTNTSGEN